MANIDVASAELDEMTDYLAACMNRHNFTNDDVIWLIKAWTKVILNLGLTNELKAYWIMKREPQKMTGKRSAALQRALDDYETILEHSKNTSGDTYYRARDAMLNFVWDYRQRISGAQEQDFVHRLHGIMTMRDSEILQEAVMKMDQGL